MNVNGGKPNNVARSVMINMKGLIKSRICDRCDNIMEEMQPCHLKCFNCGAEMDCSEKGLTW